MVRAQVLLRHTRRPLQGLARRQAHRAACILCSIFYMNDDSFIVLAGQSLGHRLARSFSCKSQSQPSNLQLLFMLFNCQGQSNLWRRLLSSSLVPDAN